MTAKRSCIIGMVLYVVLSLTDLALTYVIIRKNIGYESNPVAEAWLHRYGWEGLATFKAVTALVFGVSVALISRHRPRTATVLVAVGCAALLVVVTYSRRMLDEAEQRQSPSTSRRPSATWPRPQPHHEQEEPGARA